jgi:hypothetical protein
MGTSISTRLIDLHEAPGSGLLDDLFVICDQGTSLGHQARSQAQVPSPVAGKAQY